MTVEIEEGKFSKFFKSPIGSMVKDIIDMLQPVHDRGL